MTRNIKVLVLTGGLGNQLFQLAAGLTTAASENLVIDRNLGRPRLNQQGSPDLDSFVFPNPLTFNVKSKKTSVFTNLGSIMFKISSKKFSNQSAQRSWIWLKDKAVKFRLFLSDGVGFDPRVHAELNGKWIFGPFHTYKYVERDSVYNFMSAMVPRVYPEWLAELKIAAAKELPIILHIRLSDYKRIPELGILRPAYFKRALDLALNEFPDSHIWLFTDEEPLALKILDESFMSKIRVINFDPTDSASNLEAMRFGYCYVLSNSTFSWWGAYLSHSPHPRVFCPENWFRKKKNPLYLIPEEWERVTNT